MSTPEQNLAIEWIAIADLKRHPRNYRGHPDAQIDHLRESIRRHGPYANATVSADNFLLRNHGVVEAAKREGYSHWPCERRAYDHDHPDALHLLVADNEIARQAEVDDRTLTDLLREVNTGADATLLGTGFDETMLAGLVLTSRPVSELTDFDAAAEWVGMPEFQPDPDDAAIKLIVRFRDEADRADFLRRLELDLTDESKATWWPPKPQDRLRDFRFEGDEEIPTDGEEPHEPADEEPAAEPAPQPGAETDAEVVAD